ncbi:DUF190 domain-containing protein [Chryseobacterium sp.]|uniref:DUF190 domain-containing protein n=1 Tax=Chryseobacterium sp. TaxID=1871047 RepID=UPI0011C72547|nr:DUF190 domain-containing protein [Chryseobacterium sp.]TXF74812.1 DUF190 domain-containing protein [Chryseobacterium sp.]
MSKKFSVLRIYFEFGKKVETHGFWKKMWHSSLKEYLLKKAKESDIKQALYFEAKSGYLNFEDIKNHHSEVPHMHHPICLELIDTDEKIKEFLETNRETLNGVKAIIINRDSEIFFH